jgi:hypothetical protein
MKAADKKAPSEMAVNLMITSTVPTTLTQSKIVFPVSENQHRQYENEVEDIRFEANVMKSA